jgi:dUTP pyrophosphatase
MSSHIVFERIDSTVVVPFYATEGAAGMDIAATTVRKVTELHDNRTLIMLGTGIKVAVPAGYYLELVPRSSTFAKTGYLIANSPGIIDCDYRGEICILVTNNCPRADGHNYPVVGSPAHVLLGTTSPIAQLILKKMEKLPIVESHVDENSTARGIKGFGHTDQLSGKSTSVRQK